MKWASRPRVALEVAAVRACQPEKTAEWDSLAARLDIMEKKLEKGEFRAAAAAPEETAAEAAGRAKAPAARVEKTEPAGSGRAGERRGGMGRSDEDDPTGREIVCVFEKRTVCRIERGYGAD